MTPTFPRLSATSARDLFVTALVCAALSPGCVLARGTDTLASSEPVDADPVDASQELEDANVDDDAGDEDAGIPPAPDAGTDADLERDAGARDAGPRLDAGRGNGPVDLGVAADFAVLAGAMVTSTGFTVITGDVGITPGTSLVGFPPATVIGEIHMGDATALLANLALTAAYDDAAGRTGAPIVTAGNLGGRTLPPGLYTSATTLEISTGNLTLDAGGDAGAVWVFQMGTAFSMTAATEILLINGARADNVFWQVGSSATLGAGCTIAGNFMADQSITVGIGATVEGRLLARIASVTVANNVVTSPTR